MNPNPEFKNGWWKQFKRPLALRAGVLLLCLAAAGSPAQTQAVTDCSESALRAAMAGGGTVIFTCNGTITLSNTVVIGTNTVLDGSARQVTIGTGNIGDAEHNHSGLILNDTNPTFATGSGFQLFLAGLERADEGTQAGFPAKWRLVQTYPLP